MIVLAIATGLVLGVPWLEVAMLGVAAVAPLPGLAVVVVALGISGLGRGGHGSDEAVFLAAVASEMRAGASLRTAVVQAAGRTPDLGLGLAVRLADVGAPMSRVADAVSERLSTTASLVRPALIVAAQHGGRSALVLDRLALFAERRVELRREIAIATAQVKVTVAVLVALPLLVLGLLLVSGGIAEIVASGPVGVGALVLGLSLETMGIVAVATIAHRVRA